MVNGREAVVMPLVTLVWGRHRFHPNYHATQTLYPLSASYSKPSSCTHFIFEICKFKFSTILGVSACNVPSSFR